MPTLSGTTGDDVVDLIRDAQGDRAERWRGDRSELLETRPLTPDETTALDQWVNESSVRDKAEQALTANAADVGTNDTFLAIAAPTNAQTLAQVKELTRQSTRQARELNGLVRLVLRRFESAD